MRTKEYVQETGDHLHVAGLGLEWLVPIIILILATALGEWAIGLTLLEILASEIMLILYYISILKGLMFKASSISKEH